MDIPEGNPDTCKYSILQYNYSMGQHDHVTNADVNGTAEFKMKYLDSSHIFYAKATCKDAESESSSYKLFIGKNQHYI